MGSTADGEDNWAVFPGTARVENGALYLDRGVKSRFEVRPEWIERIRAVDPDLRSTLQNADYFLALSVGTPPEGEGGSDFLETGLKWPD